jgi:membrane-anchored glycerophosphoryl diester phosphodiesterase (GDPDase)
MLVCIVNIYLWFSVLIYKIIVDLTSGLGLWFMIFNATFNNISVITGRSVLLVGGNGIPGENHRPVASH